MTITYTLSLQDYKEVVNRIAKKKPSILLKRLFNIFLPSLTGFIGSIINNTQHSLIVAIIYAIIVLIIWFPIYLSIRQFRIRKNYKKFKQNLSRSLTPEQEGIRYINPKLDGIIDWNEISQIDNDYKFIYIILKNSLGIYVPKHAFSTPSESAEFLLQIQTFWYQHN